MAKSKPEKFEEPEQKSELELRAELELWPDDTDPAMRELMESHQIMGPKAMFDNWERSQSIIEAHGFKWVAPE